MSATIFEWRSLGRDARTTSLKRAEAIGREVKSRPAVDRPFVSPVAGDSDDPVGVGCRTRIGGEKATGLRWPRACRNLLGTIREIWLFSNDVCGDWRQPCRRSKSQENSRNRSA